MSQHWILSYLLGFRGILHNWWWKRKLLGLIFMFFFFKWSCVFSTIWWWDLMSLGLFEWTANGCISIVIRLRIPLEPSECGSRLTHSKWYIFWLWNQNKHLADIKLNGLFKWQHRLWSLSVEILFTNLLRQWLNVRCLGHGPAVFAETDRCTVTVILRSITWIWVVFVAYLRFLTLLKRYSPLINSPLYIDFYLAFGDWLIPKILFNEI